MTGRDTEPAPPAAAGAPPQAAGRTAPKVKVLHLIDTLEVGGTEKSLQAILPRLQATESVVCHLYPGEALKPALTRAGIRVVSLDLGGRYAFSRACRAVAALVRAERPALIHASLFRAGVVARAVGAMAGVPVVDSFVNDSYAAQRYAALGRRGRAKLRLVQALDALSARCVTHFIAVSASARSANCRAIRVSESRCTVIPRGRDPALFSALGPEELAALRRQLGAAAGAELVLSVARFLPRKGQEFLLRALPAVLARRPDAVLLLAGDGPARSSCEQLARDLALGSRAVFLGTREDVPALLQAADVFAFPSLYEGCGGALIEAMLAGCPIVAADTPAHRENIAPGTTGLLVPPADPAALAGAVAQLLELREGARRLGERARAAARGRFALERVVRLQEDLYREVARGAGR